MADAGYDVADYRDVDPLFGTLADAEALLGEAHDAGLRVILDIVPNHTSDQHPWFQEALAAGPGLAPRASATSSGPGAAPAATSRRTTGAASSAARPGPGSPSPTARRRVVPAPVRARAARPELGQPRGRAPSSSTILRFWFDRGVDGFRIDVAHWLVKADGLPDLDGRAPSRLPGQPDRRRGRRTRTGTATRCTRSTASGGAVADSYAEPRVFVAEAWVERPERLARYVRAGRAAHGVQLRLPAGAVEGRARCARRSTPRWPSTTPSGAPPTWVLSNHDVARHVSRLGRAQRDEPAFSLDDLLDRPLDLDLGLRRARAAALLMLALPGGAYVYQGEELGLPEVEDLPDDVLQDPTWARSGHTERGRDGCRVPLPWSGTRPPFGFSPEGASAAPWLPQPAVWAELTAEAQAADPDSILALYRDALRLRRALPGARGRRPALAARARGRARLRPRPGFGCVVNLSAAPVPLPAGAEVLLSQRTAHPRGRGGPRHGRLVQHGRLSPGSVDRAGATGPAPRRGRRRAPGRCRGPAPRRRPPGPSCGAGKRACSRAWGPTGRSAPGAATDGASTVSVTSVCEPIRSTTAAVAGSRTASASPPSRASCTSVGRSPSTSSRPTEPRSSGGTGRHSGSTRSPSWKPAQSVEATRRPRSSPMAGAPTKPATKRSTGRR